MAKNKEILQLERLLKKVKAWKSEAQKEKDATRAIFLLTPEKMYNHKMTELQKIFAYYINKVLMAK